MLLTIGNWIFIGIILLAGFIVAGCALAERESATAIIAILTALVIAGISMFGLNWWHTNTASGARSMKDYKSNIENGIEREITITAEDGREIFHYEGKIDIETNHEGNANYLLFESEDGRRYIIYYGVQDTVLIIEKAQ